MWRKSLKNKKEINLENFWHQHEYFTENYVEKTLTDGVVSTGMRIGELVLLNREDIDFNERECIVFDKGKKERVVYFDARTKIHFSSYK